MQGMERDALHKLETGAIPIGQDRSPFVIPMNPSRMWIDLPGNGGWLDGKRGRYKDKKGRCDWCAFQRYILAAVIFTFIIWVGFKIWTSD